MTISVSLSNDKMITYQGDCEADLTEGHLTIIRYDVKPEPERLAIFAPVTWTTCMEAEPQGVTCQEAAA